MRTAFALALLGVVAAAGEARILRHDLSVTVDPQKTSFESVDRIDVEGPGTLRVPSMKGISVEAEGLEGQTLEVPAGRHTYTFTFRGSLANPVQKQKGPTWVAGDQTPGTIGARGSYLVRGFFVPSSRPAALRITIDVPLPHRAVAQGRRVAESEKDGHYRVTFESKSTDGVVVATGPWVVTEEKIGETSCRTYLYEADKEHAAILLSSLSEEIPRFTALFGPVPGGRFDVVENFFATGYGFANFTLLGDTVIRYVCAKAKRERLTALPAGYLDHELVHCWLGNHVLVAYDKGNWCEALTTYFTNYGAAEREKRDAAYRRKVSRMFSLKVRPETDYPLVRFREKRHDYENDIGYGKGSMVFHMLNRELGRDVFLEAVRHLVESRGGRAIGWDGLVAALSEGAGRDLEPWFKAWLERTGAPVLELGRLHVQGNRVTGTLLQAHEGRAYPLRVPIRVVTETGEEEHWIWSASKESPFRFETKAPPKKVAVDPDHEVFRKIPTNRVAPCFSAVLNAPQRVGFGDEKVLAGFGLANPGIPHENAAHFYLGLEGEQLSHIQAEAVRQDGSLRLEEGKFSLKGQTYDGPADGLLFSYRRRNGSFATFFHGNAPEAFGRVSYLPYYASEGWVVFKNGRPAARGAHPGDPRTRATVGRAHRRPPGTLLDDILWLTETKHGGRAPGTRSAHELANELRGRIVKAGLRYVPWPPFPVRRANLVGPRLLTILDGEEKIRLPDSFYPMHAGASVAEPVVFNRVVEHPADDVREALVLLPEDAASDVAARYAKSGARVVAVVSSDESFTKRGREAAWPGAVPPALAQKVRARRGSLSAIAAKEIASSGGPRLDVPLIYLAPKAAAELKRRNKGGVIECRTSWTHYTTSNIVATLGARRGMRKSVLVSAHWDGVGKIGGRVAEGASDNAAGVAVLLWVAEQLKRNEASLKRPVVFALFGAEELGLLGSRQFVQGLKSPKVPIPVPLVAINIDGIGSAPKRDIFLIGRSLVPALFKRFETARAKTNLELGRDIDTFAYREGSDHWPLHEAGIPAVTVYCADYRAMNTLLDSSELVDMELVRETARLVYRMVRELATAESLDELE